MYKAAKDIQIGDTVLTAGGPKVVTRVGPGMYRGGICISFPGGWSDQHRDTLIEVAGVPETDDQPEPELTRASLLQKIPKTNWTKLDTPTLAKVMTLISD